MEKGKEDKGKRKGEMRQNSKGGGREEGRTKRKGRGVGCVIGQ